MISDEELRKVWVELQRRIEHIAIALQGTKRKPIQNRQPYSIKAQNMPSVGETVDAFLNWNCAILTAFRSKEGLTEEENDIRNKNRNAELKKKLRSDQLLFRPVDGWYKEYGAEKYVRELSMFVINADIEGKGQDAFSFFARIYRHAEFYEQDCFLFTFPGENRVAFLVATSDGGRSFFRGDLSFAGPLYTHIESLDSWTQCKDGKISFLLSGMIQKGGTGNIKIKIGEGDIFDVDSYNPDGFIVIWDKTQNDSEGNNPQKDACQKYRGDKPLVERYFLKDEITAEDIRRKVSQSLNDLLRQKCKRIGFHCSACLNGSYVDGAGIAFETVLSWDTRNSKKFSQITIVDSYGDYSNYLAKKKN